MSQQQAYAQQPAPRPFELDVEKLRDLERQNKLPVFTTFQDHADGWRLCGAVTAKNHWPSPTLLLTCDANTVWRRRSKTRSGGGGASGTHLGLAATARLASAGSWEYASHVSWGERGPRSGLGPAGALYGKR